jgi:hypothetical protein
MGDGFVDIKPAPFDEGSAIIDDGEGSFAIGWIGQAQLGAEWEGKMGCCVTGGHDCAAGGFVAVEGVVGGRGAGLGSLGEGWGCQEEGDC